MYMGTVSSHSRSDREWRALHKSYGIPEPLNGREDGLWLKNWTEIWEIWLLFSSFTVILNDFGQVAYLLCASVSPYVK